MTTPPSASDSRDDEFCRAACPSSCTEPAMATPPERKRPSPSAYHLVERIATGEHPRLACFSGKVVYGSRRPCRWVNPSPPSGPFVADREFSHPRVRAQPMRVLLGYAAPRVTRPGRHRQRRPGRSSFIAPPRQRGVMSSVEDDSLGEPGAVPPAIELASAAGYRPGPATTGTALGLPRGGPPPRAAARTPLPAAPWFTGLPRTGAFPEWSLGRLGVQRDRLRTSQTPTLRAGTAPERGARLSPVATRALAASAYRDRWRARGRGGPRPRWSDRRPSGRDGPCQILNGGHQRSAPCRAARRPPVGA